MRSDKKGRFCRCHDCGIAWMLEADWNTRAGAALRAELAQAKEKLEYVHSMGLRFGMMKSSDRPEPYLAHDWTEDSDFMRMSREWSAGIGMEVKVEKLTADLAAARKERDEANSKIIKTAMQGDDYCSKYRAERDAALSAKQELEAHCDALEKALPTFDPAHIWDLARQYYTANGASLSTILDAHDQICAAFATLKGAKP